MRKFSIRSVIGIAAGLPMPKPVSTDVRLNCRKRSEPHFFVGRLSPAAYSEFTFRGHCRTR